MQSEVLGIAIAEFGAQYDRYRRRCNALTSGLVGATKRAYRQYTEAVLHPYVLSAPLAHHCYNKPLGYPGDYMLMSYLYDPQPYGNTLYDKLIHEVVCRHEPMGDGVVKRKNFLLEQIRGVVASARSSTSMPCRVLSLACGPAQEVLEFATEYRDSCAPTVFTLIDQDQRSLSYVNSSLSRLLIPGSTNIEAKYLYLGFMQMIDELDAFDSLPEQDLIYAAGLFDYLKTASAQQLAQRLFQKLRRGGRLVIGNFKLPNDATWALEYWMDWHLIYRNHGDMKAIAELIDEPHSVNLTCDASGYTNILTITRS
jgi:SAM-dependent methyltransferase